MCGRLEVIVCELNVLRVAAWNLPNGALHGVVCVGGQNQKACLSESKGAGSTAGSDTTGAAAGFRWGWCWCCVRLATHTPVQRCHGSTNSLVAQLGIPPCITIAFSSIVNNGATTFTNCLNGGSAALPAPLGTCHATFSMQLPEGEPYLF